MSDERRQQPTVNLQELERQLREAARARQRAQASVDTLTNTPVERPAAPSIPNPPMAPPAPSAQPGLPQTPTNFTPQPSVQPQPAPQPSFRPLNPPMNTSPAAPVQPQAPQPAMPQANSFFTPPPASREPVQSFAPAPQTFAPLAEEPNDSQFDVLKTDRMDDVYPPIETEAVEQNQFYSAAAYEEPAADAYDRYTEDQFPRIEPEPRSGGIVKAVIWIVFIAIIGTGGYFAWPIVQGLFTSGSQTAKAPPLIKADPAPVKVEPETQPQDNANAPKDIFTKHANEDPKAAQMASSAEQPADVNAAVKAGSATQVPGSKPAIVPLVPGTGEPRLVKTVTVRSDGSIIPEKSDPALAAKTVPAGPKVITMPQPVAPIAAQPNAAAAAPSSEPALPPKPVSVSPEFVLDGPVPLPPERAADTTQDFSLPLDTITTPLPASEPAPAPAAAAPAPAAAPTPAAPAAVTPGKDFAVQFGAPETEAKGNELKTRVEKQFSAALTGATIAVVKGESNGKPVFRVRAVNYTREEANAVCQQVTAAGGQCFVSRNN